MKRFFEYAMNYNITLIKTFMKMLFWSWLVASILLLVSWGIAHYDIDLAARILFYGMMVLAVILSVIMVVWIFKEFFLKDFLRTKAIWDEGWKWGIEAWKQRIKS
ncbi:hypothetical protein [Pelosinus propionicus]|uniref:Uncharacterized protein n=1 Tax=Pelosinus propionicus DSM 13327 TaxID=1123291 RepID=A0A1I4QDY3_9FIRM|nr:hypothetical protein [Pelosinus propionicus]SFM38268.1 hypothetical protein SAMN04490355_10963 [Pelosinus propionicus DSM 13327]